MESIVYNQKGQESGKIKLPEAVFGAKWKEALVQQVVTAMMANARTPVAHTKNRGEVSGTGKKPWKQKGTGRARHGSRRSPIWVGGGVSHGPRNDRNYDSKINKKMRAGALFSVLSQKLKEGKVIFVDSLDMGAPKTAEAKKVLTSLAKIKGFEKLSAKKNAGFVSMFEVKEGALKSFRNFANLEIGKTQDLNPVDVLKYKFLIIENPEKSVEVLAKRAK